MTRDDPVAECFNCGAPATESLGGTALCTDCVDTLADGDATGECRRAGDDDGAESWREADFATTEPGVWPDENRHFREFPESEHEESALQRDFVSYLLRDNSKR